MRSHQIMMDVVGNNISNVNTQGYKRSQTLFTDVLSQIDSNATAPTEQLGGRNPAQVGLGVQMSGTAQQFGQGFLQITNRELDVAIQGEGFFIHKVSGEDLYTRNGAFFMDADGRLVTSQGGLVQGWMADEVTGDINANNPTDNISLPIGNQSTPVITTEIKLGGNLPSTATIGDQAFAGVEVYDAIGNAVEVNFTFEKTGATQWTASATYGDPAVALTLTDNVVNFTDGEVATPADFNIDIGGGQIPGIDDPMLVTIGGVGERRLTQYGETNSLTVVTQDGAPGGVLQSMRIATDGTVIGTFSNGLTNPIARLALANFSNPEGLERVTGTNWRASVNSGLAQTGTTSTGGRGLIAPGTLEMSNVDLALEFTELIRSQRGFQANSRVVTSADELLQEIVNLKR